MMYTMLYMSHRTQIYLTDEQRRRLDEIGTRTGKSMARVIREALNAYLASAEPEAGKALAATFGATPEIEVPSRAEWDRD